MNIPAWLAGLLAKPVVNAVMTAFRAAEHRKLSETELRSEVEKTVADTIRKVATEELQARRDVLITELRGESALQRLWRPVVALTAFFSYWFVIVAYPFMQAWGIVPQVRFGEEGLRNLFWLTMFTTGGYIGSRTLEKVMRMRQ